MSTIYLVLAGNERDFRVCAAFEMGAFANSYAAAFKHHAERVWVQEVPQGVGQDFRVGDKPFVVRFSRKGECLEVVENPPLQDFTCDAPPHRFAEDQSSVEIFRWAPNTASAKHEAEVRLDYAPLKAWVEKS